MKTIYYTGNLQMPSMPGDVGYNLPSNADLAWVGCGTIVTVPTGIRLRMHEGIYARIVTRSSAADRGFHVLEGTIDSGYTGELFVRAISLAPLVQIRAGESIAQVIFTRADHPTLVPVSRDSTHFLGTFRGMQGFGSTDMPKESFAINPEPGHNHD